MFKISLFFFNSLLQQWWQEKISYFFLSSGNVNILESHHITQKIGHKSDNVIVVTMFLGS